MGFFSRLKPPKSQEVDVITFNQDMEAPFLTNYYFPRIPVLIKNGANVLSNFSEWNVGYIKQKYGAYECTIVTDSRPASSKKKDTLKNYFNKYPGKSTLTLEQVSRSNKIYFLDDLTIPNPLFNKGDIARYFFFNSVKDAGTLPHKHLDAFNFLQTGKKHWIFYDAKPEVSPRGHQELTKTFADYPVGSHAKDWFKNESEKLPRRVEKVYECIQEAGDIVYIPEGFSHTVLNHTDVMGLVVETHRKHNF